MAHAELQELLNLEVLCANSLIDHKYLNSSLAINHFFS